MYRAGIRELRIAKKGYAGRYYAHVRSILSSVFQGFVDVFGVEEFVEGLAEPYFLDFLTVISGLEEVECDRTVVMGAILKEVLTPQWGAAVLGGSSISRFDVPVEMRRLAEVFNLSDRWVDYLTYCSRMVAKIDSVAIQDGYELYFHMMIITRARTWVIIQQSYESFTGRARRYHWFSKNIRSFVEEPHSGIIAEARKPAVLDMTSRDSADARMASVDLTSQGITKLKRLQNYFGMIKQTKLDGRPDEVIDVIIPARRINWSVVKKLSENPPRSYEELLAERGVGKEIVRLLAFGSILYYDAYPSFKDPAVLGYEILNRYGSAEVLWRLQQVVDAIKESRLSEELKRRCLSRLSSSFGNVKGIGG